MPDFSRFMVVETENHNYNVVDRHNGQKVKFSFTSPPTYGECEWQNYYAARSFAHRLAAKNA